MSWERQSRPAGNRPATTGGAVGASVCCQHTTGNGARQLLAALADKAAHLAEHDPTPERRRRHWRLARRIMGEGEG